MSLGVKSINVISELDRLGVKWTSASEDEVRLLCPVHEDESPSASLNVKEHVWKCFVPSCGAAGDFVSFIAYYLKQPRAVVLVDLQKRYPDLDGVSEIPSGTVEKFHRALDKAGPLLLELRKRGLTDEMMRQARLGFHDGRITIPVFDEAGRCTNVRRYLPGAPGPQKMRNTAGHGSPALYRAGLELAKAERVIVCGGEMKALVIGTLMREAGWAAVSSTGGEGHWRDDWSLQMTGKDVAVCMDVDDAGTAAARRVAVALYGKARRIKVLQLPLDKGKFPKGDVNDWVGQCGATVEDVVKLVTDTPDWVPPQKQIASQKPARKLPLSEAISTAHVGEAIEVDAVIAASDTTPFLVPKDVDVDCDHAQPGCATCPVHLEKVDTNGWVRVSVDAGAQAVLGMVNATDRDQHERIRESLGIPLCKVVRFYPRSHHVAHDVRLAPPMDMTGGRVNDAWYPAIVISSRTPELNVPCRMRGAVWPHPKTQQAVALVSDLEELEDTLATFQASKEELRELARFRPADATLKALEDRVASIANDLAHNVTWIYGRSDLHVALDLMFHSVLLFNFGGRQVNGWMNLLVIGDSAQGKSECANRLLTHYGVGDKVDCKNATVAGLLGGLEQMGNRWFVRWGVIPARDRTALIMEELKGASVEVLSKLTEMRSSGIAEIPKIERRKALARTRIAMISNPRKPRPMASFHFGVEAVAELIGSLEDVRRFDLAVALGRDDVPQDVVDMPRRSRPNVPHSATAETSRRLILWAWTRKPDQVKFSDEAVQAVHDESRKLTDKYSEGVPLVDKGTMRLKMARMAAAVAARTFSTMDGMTLVVEPRHAQLVGKLVDRVYSAKVMGYADYSAAQKMMSEVQDPEVIVKAIRNTRHPLDLASVLLRRDTVSVEDIQAAGGTDLDAAKTMLSLLVRKGALLRVTRTEYAKNPEFIELLKQVRSSPLTRKDQHDLSGEEF